MTPGSTWTFLKPWVNQCVFLMEMFFLSCVNELCIYPGLCLSSSWFLRLRTNKGSRNQYVLLIHCSPAAAKSLQSCPTLCDPIDGSPPGSAVPGILQARTLEWVAISFSNAWKWKVKVKSLSCARLLATPWTAAYQAPPSMGFSRQEYWSGVPLPSLTLFSYSMLIKLYIYLETCLSSRFMSIVLWPGITHLVPMLSQNACCGWGPGATPSFETSPFSN